MDKVTERRFFTDEERQAKLVEAILSGDVKKCRTCNRRFIAYELGAVTHTFTCPSCLQRKTGEEYAAGAQWSVSNSRVSATAYLERLQAELRALDGIIWEQRWIPN